jgi:23S rRNA (guanosine2251-2'-O)-methyltransferase
MIENIFGIQPVRMLLQHDPSRFKKVFVSEDRKDTRLTNLVSSIKSSKITIELVSRRWLDTHSQNNTHQGVLAYIKSQYIYQEVDLPDILRKTLNPFLLVLDNITDPHNLGACLRSAEAAGVSAVVIPKDRSAKLDTAARKVSCGAAEIIPIVRVTNLSRTLVFLQHQGIQVIGTDSESHNILYNSKMIGPIALVLGSEDKGMRRLTRLCCDKLVSIPNVGITESLNVSVAAGICLFEIVRQRGRYNNTTDL